MPCLLELSMLASVCERRKSGLQGCLAEFATTSKHLNSPVLSYLKRQRYCYYLHLHRAFRSCLLPLVRLPLRAAKSIKWRRISDIERQRIGHEEKQEPRRASFSVRFGWKQSHLTPKEFCFSCFCYYYRVACKPVPRTLAEFYSLWPLAKQ